MAILKKYKNIIIGAVVIAVGFAGYNFFFAGRGADVLVSTEQNAADDVVGTELLALLLELRSVELDESIFSDPAFNALRDFGLDLIPEPVGRENPFAPL